MMMSRKFVLMQLILLCSFPLGSALGEVWRFDFGPAAGTNDNNGNPIQLLAGYIAVDSSTTYGLDPNTGLTYGVFNGGATNVFEGDKSAWSTRESTTNMALTYLFFDDAGAGFEFEVPNGDYFVTVGTGNPGWDTWGRMTVEDEWFTGDSNNANLGILDIAPDDPVNGPFVTTWTIDTNLSKHVPPNPSFIRTWGANNGHPTTWSFAEILYLDRERVTVADGKLTVRGMQQSNGDYFLNFLEVIPANCASLIEAGYGVQGDLNSDCSTDFIDFAAIAGQWMQCNDPTDSSCTKNW